MVYFKLLAPFTQAVSACVFPFVVHFRRAWFGQATTNQDTLIRANRNAKHAQGNKMWQYALNPVFDNSLIKALSSKNGLDSVFIFILFGKSNDQGIYSKVLEVKPCFNQV